MVRGPSIRFKVILKALDNDYARTLVICEGPLYTPSSECESGGACVSALCPRPLGSRYELCIFAIHESRTDSDVKFLVTGDHY